MPRAARYIGRIERHELHVGNCIKPDRLGIFRSDYLGLRLRRNHQALLSRVKRGFFCASHIFTLIQNRPPRIKELQPCRLRTRNATAHRANP